MFRKLTLTIILVIFGIATHLYAQTSVTWSGDIGGHTYSSDTEVTLAGDVTLKGNIIVSNGATLTIKPDNGTKITRNGNFCFSVNGTPNSNSQAKLVIKGTESKRVVLDGEAVYATPGDARTTATSGGHENPMILCNGELDLQYVDVCNCYNPKDDGTAMGGGIRLTNLTSISGTHNPHTINMDHVKIYGCCSNAGSAIYFGCQSYHALVTMTACEVYQCNSLCSGQALGGTLRTGGPTSCTAVLDGCLVHDNWSGYNSGTGTRGFGAGVYWNASAMNGGNAHPTKLVIKGDSKIYDNVAAAAGGGLFIETQADLESLEVYGNISMANGGGIYFNTFNNTAQSAVVPWNVNISANVKVHDNTAIQYGGGFFLAIQNSQNIKPASGTDALFTVSLNGGQLYNNSAASGGGIYLYDRSLKSSQNYWGQTIKYETQININSGKIYGNTASANGGAIFVTKYYSGGSANASDMYVNINGGEVNGNKAETSNGGAIYISNVTDGKSDVTIEERDGKTIDIYGNQSKNNGGAVYVDGGSVTYKSGTIRENTTTDGNGGGFYVNNGNVEITGGTIKENVATVGNGGGFYSAGGIVDITGASIIKNTAAINGGAFFLGPEARITLQDGSIENNEAQNGGAIYLSSGACFEYITSEAGSPGYIRGNTATNLGGGIYLAQGTTSKKTEMKFTLNSNNLGFYDNTAEVGADDIYAYGGGTTTINIPKISDMNLGGYSIPGATLEWWEDYRNNDSRYSAGTQQGDASKIRRYRASRDADEPIWKVPATRLSNFYEKYLCLTLGFEYGKMEIRRSGLKADENAIYEITLSSELAAEFPRPTQRVIVYGTDDEGKTEIGSKLWNVSEVNFLPKGTYTVKEIPWTWYNETAYAPGKNPLTQDISTDEGKVFVFENSHHDLGETPLHDEVSKDNELSDHTSAGTDGMKLKGSWFNGVTEL